MSKLKNFFVPTPSNNYRAHLVSNGALAMYALLLIVLNFAAGSFQVQKVFALFSESEIVAQHNQQRAKVGLPPLTVNPTLEQSARAKGEAMLKADCWSHYCPNGKSPWDFFKAAGYDYLYAGENLAEGFSSSDAMMNAWMNSQTHRENILKPEFTEIGVAIVIGDYQGETNNTLVVVHFGHPAGTPAVLPSTNGAGAAQEIPVITSPAAGSQLNDSPTITGKYSKDVTVTLNNRTSGKISPEGGIFTYKPQPALVAGDYSVYASDYNDASIQSPPVSFKIIAALTNGLNTSYTPPSNIFSSFGPLQTISLILVSGLCLLFLVDFIVINRTNLKYNLRLHSRAHLHLPSLLILVLLIFMGNLHAGIS